MANANEIEKKANGTSRFLPKEIKDIDAVTEFYDLETELIKTKRNKNLLLYFSILLFFTVVIGSVFYFTKIVEQQSKDFEINISALEDLRLKDVIDSATRYENNLDLLKIQLDIIKINEKKEILIVQKQYYQNEIGILAKDLNDQKTDKLILENRNAELIAIEAINSNFKLSTTKKEQEISKIESEIEKEKETGENQKSKFISNIDKLNAIKNAKLKKEHDSGVVALKEYYEAYVDYIVLKYNPVFKSKRITNIMENKKGIINQYSYLDSFDEFLLFEGVFTQYDFKSFRTKIDKFFEITDRLNRIPYFNSIKPAIKKINDLTYSISHDYENLIKRIKQVVKSKNTIIASKNLVIDTREETIRNKNQAITALNSNLILVSLEVEDKERIIREKERTITNKDQSLQIYQNALTILMQQYSEGGFIIQVQSNQLDIYVNPAISVKTGMIAGIYRKDEEYIGELLITSIDDTIKATVTALIKNKTAQPFDKLIFRF